MQSSFLYGPKSLPKSPPDCPILCNWVFESFILADESFAKALRIFKTCLLVNNNLCKKIFSSLESPIIFDERFKVTLVSFFIADFNLLYVILSHFYIKEKNNIRILLQFLVKNLKQFLLLLHYEKYS